jgi:hypothetical protein
MLSRLHCPTDSSWLGDGAGAPTHTMKKIESKSGGLKIRDGIGCAAYGRVLWRCLIGTTAGITGRRAAGAAVPGASQLDAKRDESDTEGVGRSEVGSAAPHSRGRTHRRSDRARFPLAGQPLLFAMY